MNGRRNPPDTLHDAEALSAAVTESVERRCDRRHVRAAPAGERPDAQLSPGDSGIDCTWRVRRGDWAPEARAEVLRSDGEG